MSFSHQASGVAYLHTTTKPVLRARSEARTNVPLAPSLHTSVYTLILFRRCRSCGSQKNQDSRCRSIPQLHIRLPRKLSTCWSAGCLKNGPITRVRDSAKQLPNPASPPPSPLIIILTGCGVVGRLIFTRLAGILSEENSCSIAHIRIFI